MDGDVIPSIILWRSTNFIFVIDGAHRLSALCAWMQDDYGDGTESKNFYSDELSIEQKKVAARIRKSINGGIGTYGSLDGLVGKAAADRAGIRAGAMNTRPIVVQTVGSGPSGRNVFLIRIGMFFATAGAIAAEWSTFAPKYDSSIASS